MSEIDRSKLKISLAGRRITVLGAGLSGIALAELAHHAGAEVFVSDAADITSSALAKLDDLGIDSESRGHTDRIFEADDILVGSGFPPRSDVIAHVTSRGRSVRGELDFVMPFLSGKFVGITGSNGKTTTTSLLGHLLSSAGRSALTVGNIGTPIASAAYGEHEMIVAELSSFQLHWASRIKLDGAIVTNFAPDHIDWHGSYERYVEAKTKAVSFVDRSGFAVVQKGDIGAFASLPSRVLALSWSDRGSDVISLDADARLATLNGEVLFGFDDTSMIGSHNMENVAMAVAAAKALGVEPSKSRELLASYVPPPHRCALVAEHDGVRYVDDSKGTNIAATATALLSIGGAKVIILGGRGKGEDYSMLLPPLRKTAKHAVLIGEERDKIADALSRGGFQAWSLADTMEDAVAEASRHADKGDVVLLSPACTSWDMYKNYGERGDHFADTVRKMISAKES